MGTNVDDARTFDFWHAFDDEQRGSVRRGTCDTGCVAACFCCCLGGFDKKVDENDDRRQ